MKAAGITVYTIGFELGGQQTAIDTLQQCASDPTKFFDAGNGEELQQAFRTIAIQLSQLHFRVADAFGKGLLRRQASSASSSPNPSSTSVTSASMTSGPSGPSAQM